MSSYVCVRVCNYRAELCVQNNRHPHPHKPYSPASSVPHAGMLLMWKTQPLPPSLWPRCVMEVATVAAWRLRDTLVPRTHTHTHTHTPTHTNCPLSLTLSLSE